MEVFTEIAEFLDKHLGKQGVSQEGYDGAAQRQGACYENVKTVFQGNRCSLPGRYGHCCCCGFVDATA